MVYRHLFLPAATFATALAACGIDSETTLSPDVDTAGRAGAAPFAGGSPGAAGKAGKGGGAGATSFEKGGASATAGSSASGGRGGTAGKGPVAGGADAGGEGGAGQSAGGGKAGKGGNTATAGAGGKMSTGGSTGVGGSAGGAKPGGAAGNDAGGAGTSGLSGSGGAADAGAAGAAGNAEAGGPSGGNAGAGGTAGKSGGAGISGSAGKSGAAGNGGGGRGGAAGNGGGAGSTCGNGKLDPKEDCDPSVGVSMGLPPGMVCNPATCRLPCGDSVAFPKSYRDATSDICYFLLSDDGKDDNDDTVEEAKTACKNAGGRLAIFGTDATRASVAQGLMLTDDAWVGARQDDVSSGWGKADDDWKWEETGAAVASVVWDIFQPNDGDPMGGKYEDGDQQCAVAQRDKALKLNDVGCTGDNVTTHPALCERSPAR